jgi:hypothetical protein
MKQTFIKVKDFATGEFLSFNTFLANKKTPTEKLMCVLKDDNKKVSYILDVNDIEYLAEIIKLLKDKTE